MLRPRWWGTIILSPCLTPRVICFTGTSWKGAGLSDPPAYNPAWPEDRPLQIQGLHPCIPWEQINSLYSVPNRTHLAHHVREPPSHLQTSRADDSC